MCLHILYYVTAPKSEDNAAMKKTDPKEQAVEKKGAISQRKLKIVFLQYISVYVCLWMNDKEAGLEPAVIQQVYIYTYICYGRHLSTSMLYGLTVGSTYVARVVLFLLHHLLCV